MIKYAFQAQKQISTNILHKIYWRPKRVFFPSRLSSKRIIILDDHLYLLLYYTCTATDRNLLNHLVILFPIIHDFLAFIHNKARILIAYDWIHNRPVFDGASKACPCLTVLGLGLSTVTRTAFLVTQILSLSIFLLKFFFNSYGNIGGNAFIMSNIMS